MLYTYLCSNKTMTQEEIRYNYKKISRMVHPDKATQGKTAEFEELFRNVEHAYSVLSCIVQRHLYDKFGDHGVKTYENGQEHFRGCFNIEDYQERNKRIEEIYMGIETHTLNMGVLERFDQQHFKMTLNMIEYILVLNGEEFNPLKFFTLSSYSYTTAVNLGVFGKLKFGIDQDQPSVSLESAFGGKFFDREFNFKVSKSLWNLASSSFDVSHIIGKLKNTLSLSFNGWIPTISLINMVNNHSQILYLRSMYTLGGKCLFNPFFSQVFPIKENWSYRLTAHGIVQQSATFNHKLIFNITNQLYLKWRMTNKTDFINHAIDYLAFGFSYNMNSVTKYSSSVFLKDLNILGVKFGFSYHTIKLSLPINISLLSISNNLAFGVTAGFFIGGIALLSLLHSKDRGKVYDKDNINRQCNDYNDKKANISEETAEITDLDSELTFLCCFISDISTHGKVKESLRGFKIALKGESDVCRMVELAEKQRLFTQDNIGLTIDVTNKMNKELKKEGYEEEFKHLVVETLNPSLRENESPILYCLYVVKGVLCLSKYQNKQKIKITVDFPVSGVVNKIQNMIL